MSEEFIRIGGAREHNLKNFAPEIPLDKLVVITGWAADVQHPLNSPGRGRNVVVSSLPASR